MIGSNGKTAMGLVQCPLVVADEPGAWEINAGGLVHDAIHDRDGETEFSPLRAVFIGTLAPMAVEGHWYHDMISAGTGGSRYVQAIQGDPKRWDQVGGDPAMQSADRGICRIQGEAARGTRRSAPGFPAKGTLSQLSAERTFGR